MKKAQETGRRHRRSRFFRSLPSPGRWLPLTWMLLAGTATAAEGTGQGLETCLAYLLLVPVLGALGVGLGSFAFLVNHLFRTRIDTVHRILRGRPGISFVTGIAVTILALGLIMMLAAAPGLQLLVLLIFLLGLVCFAAGAVTRFCAHRMETDPAEEDLPGPAAHLKAGLLISLANLLPFAGSLLVLGLALAGTGAVLLGYFASAGRAAASLAPEPEGPGSRETPSLE